MMFKTVIDHLNSFLELLPKTLIALVIALFILFPDFINDRLTRVGVTEGSIAGFKWKSRLQVTNTELLESEAARKVLEEQLEEAQGLIDELQQGASVDSSTQQQVDSLKSKSRDTIESSEQISATVGRVIEQNKALISRAQPAAAPASENWGIIFGSLPSQDGAEAKLASARDLGYTANLYHRRGRYRRVAEFESELSAENAILTFRNQLRSDSYVVNLDVWCPKRSKVDDVYECD